MKHRKCKHTVRPAALKWKSMIARAITDMWDKKRKSVISCQFKLPMQISLDRETGRGKVKWVTKTTKQMCSLYEKCLIDGFEVLKIYMLL